MKTREWLKLASALVIIFLLAGGCNLFPQKSASCRITSWNQDYYDALGEWSYVEIYYEVHNTGNVDISYYEVRFKVTCNDGSEYYDWTNGINVKAGHRQSGYTLIPTAGKKATSVKITDEDYNWAGGCLGY